MIYIRADGNTAIGAGHMMRCLTIADALPGREDIVFVCADEQSALLASDRGYAARVLYTDYRQPESELPLWEAFLGKKEQHCVFLVDSYFVTDRYLEELGRLGPVALLDDLGGHAYPVAAVVNYNAFAKETDYESLYRDTCTACYVGSRYIPVQAGFLNRGYQVRERARDLLITTGGGDRENIAGRILGRLQELDVRFHVVAGRYHPCFEELERLSAENPRICVYHDVADMAALMERCDLAVTAGGTTVYELAAVGVPFIAFSYALNQEALAAYVGGQDIGGYAGAYHQDPEGTLEKIRLLCLQLSNDYSKRRERSLRQRQLVDGLGAVRLAKLLSRLE